MRLALALVAACALAGCAEDEPVPGPGGRARHSFVSDDPSQRTQNGGTTTTSTGSGGGDTSTNTGEDPERIIAEADIVQLHEGKLYALSQYSGLSIVDVSQPDHLALLGNRKLGGEPFEMYLVDGVVYAMFRNWSYYYEHNGEWYWVTTSHVEALDVSNAADITTIGSYEVPGWIADSRMVGDVVYTVSFENGYCWNCQQDPTTTVTSFAVGDPSSIAKIDELTISDEGLDYGWTRSISVTTDRIYVAGPNWGAEQSSTIFVVDISDPGGALVAGAEVPVAGQILSRWQMDERDGILRVISQPWDQTTYPSVQTFTVASSSDVAPLGQTQLVLPKPESLRAVRFDAERAYAITAEQQDPLFTIDLADPANPVQRGSVEIPGWIYHIEPRGDRLLTLGFDTANPGGSLNVSLFDVADLDAPALIRRVAFGGDWGQFAEDQDRIQKAFKILPDLGLLLVPFSVWDWNDIGCVGYDSGVQLIDWANDDLERRGVAPVRGDARRAFVHEDRIFAMSDEMVRSFSFADRDNPAQTAELVLAANVSHILVAGEYVVRVAADWWTAKPRLDVVPTGDPARHQPLGALDLGEILSDIEGDSGCYYWSYWSVRLFAHDHTVYLVWPSLDGQNARVITIDITDPTEPTYLAHIDVPIDAFSYGGWYYYGGVLVAGGDTVVQVGQRLVFERLVYPLDQYGYPMPWSEGLVHGGELRVVDLSDPANPAELPVAALPEGTGHTGLIAQGGRVLFSHWEPLEAMPGKAKFYFDRADVSGGAPVLLAPINVPGSLVSYDEASGHLLTVDYVRKTEHVDRQACYDLFGYSGYFVPDTDGDWDGMGTCTAFDRSLAVVAVDEAFGDAAPVDQETLSTRDSVSNLVVGDDRVFFTSWTYSQTGESTSHVWVVGGIVAGSLEVAEHDLADTWWAWPIAAQGKTLVAASWPGAVVTVDTTDMASPQFVKVNDVPWWADQALVDGDRVLLALGPWGLQVVDLP